MAHQRRRPNNDGSVYQRKSDGRWTGALSLARGRRKYFSGRTQREVLDKLTKARRDLQQGVEPAPERRRVGEYLTRWLEDTAKPKLRPSTYQSYSQIIRLHLLPDLGKIPLFRLTREDVQALLRKKTSEGKSPRTVGYIRAVLRHALRQAVIDGDLARNVAALATPPRIPHHEITPLTLEQAKQLLAAAKGDRLEAFYVVTLSLGLRRGEGLGLRWSDVDLSEGIIRVSQSLLEVGGKLIISEPKSARSRRQLPLPPRALEAMKAHRARQLQERLQAGPKWQDTGFVFTSTIGTPVQPRNVFRDFRAMLQRANLPPIRLHDLRHSAATLLLAQNVPARTIMEILGHSQISVTMDLYSHVMPSMLKEALGKVDTALG